MRVKIQRGTSSIEVEGEYAEVDKVLTAFWGAGASNENEPEFVTGAAIGEVADRTRRTRKGARRAAAPKAANEFDADAVANQMKNDPRWPTFLRKIVMVEGDRANKVRFVSWYAAEQPLTSGNIHRVLQALGIKLDNSNVSRGITGNCKSEYLRDASGYRLSAPALASFQTWLLNDGAEAA